MKYILIFVTWNAVQGGSPATAEFNTLAACEAARADIVKSLSNQPALWYAKCHEKG